MKRIVLGLAAAAGLLIAGSQANAQYTLVKSVLANGGAPMANSSYSVNGTIGQTIIGRVTNSSYVAHQGFWFVPDDIGAVPGGGFTAEGNVLHQNFPNPFKENTEIKFTLARRAPITLKVFGMPGQEVATLAEGIFEAGEHKTNFEDAQLPSGTYFYQLQVGPHILRRQMTLVR